MSVSVKNLEASISRGFVVSSGSVNFSEGSVISSSPTVRGQKNKKRIQSLVYIFPETF